MKTLKKTLCLVLAVVLALGVMVLPAYADKKTYDNFKDKDDVDYKYEEAVATLTGMGIINGRDNKVEAAAHITRAEAVTMVVRAILGNAETALVTGKPTKFTDVPASHYAAKYVNYAVQQGIVAGKSETQYAPNDLVTGYELARMALVAAGIKTDFTSSLWQEQTGPAAGEKGLLVGLETITDLNKPLTREESAQLIWNMVKYTPDPLKTEVKVDDGTKTTTYTVTYPDSSIGGKVYGLTAKYSYQSGSDVDTDFFNRPVVEWSNGKTDYSKVVYSEIRQRAIVQFYADAFLDVGEVLSHLGLSTGKGRTYKVYVDGNVHSDGYLNSNEIRSLDVSKPAETSVFTTAPKSTRGAEVSVYPGLNGTTYDIYVVYPYATVLTNNPVSGSTSLSWPDSGTDNDVYVGSLKKGDVVTFNVTNKNGTADVVNLKSESPTMTGQITGRNPNSADPYVRVNQGEKLYFSAKAVKIDMTGTVTAIDHKTITLDKNKYYKVWLDDARNILALQETDGPQTALEFDDYGYVLEFSAKVGQQTVHVHDNEYGEAKESKLAEANVVMVSLKTGLVNIYNLKVVQVGNPGSEQWYIPGLDGLWYNGIQINANVNGVNADTSKQTVINGFVAFKKVDDGKYVMDLVKDLTKPTTEYKVATSFATDRNDPGRVTITPVNGSAEIKWADDNSELYVLDNHKQNADGSIVASYDVTHLEGYRKLGSVTVENSDTCIVDGHFGQHYIGKNALFIIDTKTNTVKTAYIFRDYVAPAPMNDFYIFLGRDESNLEDGYTWFNFIHNGDVVSLPVDALDEKNGDLLLDEDNSEDAKHYPVVELDIDPFGVITQITKVSGDGTLGQYEVQLNKVGSFVVNSDNGGFIAQSGVTPNGKSDGSGFTFDTVWYVFDAATGKVVKNPANGSLVGKNVYVYYSDQAKTKISIIWVETNPAIHG